MNFAKTPFRMDIDEEIEERVIMQDLPDLDLSDIKRAVAGFLENKRKSAKGFQSFVSSELRTYWHARFFTLNVRHKTYKGKDDEVETYHENAPDLTAPRMWHQFRAISTAICLIEGRSEVTRADVDLYFSLIKS